MLEVQDLNKSFGTLQALKGLSLKVQPGEIFGFVGSNGAGKTTAMRIMLGVLSTDSGRVSWNGKEVNDDVRRKIGYMPEERGLYPKMQVGRQLEYFARLHGLGKAEAAQATEQWTDRLGVAGRRNDNVQKLSLGNQQRVQLAAALVHDPIILVLDEPFSGLDPVAVNVMSQVLKDKAKSGVPVIFSSTNSISSSGCATASALSPAGRSWQKAQSTSCATLAGRRLRWPFRRALTGFTPLCLRRASSRSPIPSRERPTPPAQMD